MHQHPISWPLSVKANIHILDFHITAFLTVFQTIFKFYWAKMVTIILYLFLKIKFGNLRLTNKISDSTANFKKNPWQKNKQIRSSIPN